MEVLDATCLGKFTLILVWSFWNRGSEPEICSGTEFLVIRAFQGDQKGHTNSRNSKGAHAETCGGPNRLDVYSYSPSTSPAPSQPITTSSLTRPSSTSIAIQPTSSSTGTGKRGIAYSTGNPDGNATYANLFTGYSKITWGYDWGYPSHGLDSYFELYVMFMFLISCKRANKDSLSQCTDAMGPTQWIRSFVDVHCREYGS